MKNKSMKKNYDKKFYLYIPKCFEKEWDEFRERNGRRTGRELLLKVFGVRNERV
jgi:hypothetical protein